MRAWCRLSLRALGRAREEIDAINVYPVADGDTGTNLYLTVESAAQAVEAAFDGHATARPPAPAPRTPPGPPSPRRSARCPTARSSAPGAIPGRSSRSCCAA
ncbi:hypothetical protein VSR01_29530 [Actinacidiphila sp. DG2A-62]|uniref:hypothetical protein n=1 Tax=Actinacidiphila sp. DG2A-62 TaxID=3108821 RepID=UPI002DBF222B|nr:hypothetical protein [Actinacidiphila sp. DG2A-62]MEC3997420.1 hypothetical protein [Actinacidiphila sp. DG2A-62]